MDPAMYIFLNRGLEMSTGKAAAQAAHAAVEAYKQSELNVPSLVNQWYKGGHYKKLVMAANHSTHLFTIERYLRDRGFCTVMIIDEGMTEIPAHTATALGVEIVDKDSGHVAATFASFDLYREVPKRPEPDDIGRPQTHGRQPVWQRFLTAFSNDTPDRNRG